MSSTDQAPAQPLATSREVAEYLGVSPNYLAKLRMEDGAGPDFVRVNARAIRYDWQAVHQWIADRTRTSTAA